MGIVHKNTQLYLSIYETMRCRQPSKWNLAMPNVISTYSLTVGNFHSNKCRFSSIKYEPNVHMLDTCLHLRERFSVLRWREIRLQCVSSAYML